MPYQVVVATMPDEGSPALAFKNWGLFSGHVQTPTLKTTSGVLDEILPDETVGSHMVS